jgi:ketosteroid isomerase-like protein
MQTLLRRILSLTALAFLCATPCPAQWSAAQKAVADADHAWEVVFAAKDLDKSVDAVSASGSVLAPNSPIATGHAAVRELFKGFFSLPGVKMSWQATSVEVAASGDFAYTSGTYELSFDAGNATSTDKGKYVTVWMREKNGTWKVVRDIFNTDLPLPK